MEEIKKVVTQTFEKEAQSFFEPLKNKMSNVLTGSFILAWLAINWRPLLYLAFSNETIEAKFKVLDRDIYGASGMNWWMYFLLPLLIAAFYAYVFPFIEPSIEWATLYKRKLRMQRNHSFLTADLNNQKSLAKTYAEIEEAKTEFKTLELKDQQIAVLQSDILNKDEEISSSMEKIKELTSELVFKTKEATTFYKELSEEISENEKLKSQLKGFLSNMMLRSPIKSDTDFIHYETEIGLMNLTDIEYKEELLTIVKAASVSKNRFTKLHVDLKLNFNSDTIFDIMKPLRLLFPDINVIDANEGWVSFEFFTKSGIPTEELENLLNSSELVIESQVMHAVY